jgi:hypothetical protein
MNLFLDLVIDFNELCFPRMRETQEEEFQSTIPVTQVPLGGGNEEEKRNESIEKDETIKISH